MVTDVCRVTVARTLQAPSWVVVLVTEAIVTMVTVSRRLLGVIIIARWTNDKPGLVAEIPGITGIGQWNAIWCLEKEISQVMNIQW